VVLVVVLVLLQLLVLHFRVVLVVKVLVHLQTGLPVVAAVVDTMEAAAEAAAMIMVLEPVQHLVVAVVQDMFTLQ